MDIDHAGERGRARFGDVFAGEPKREVIADEAEPLGLGAQLRPMLAEPEQLGRREFRAERRDAGGFKRWQIAELLLHCFLKGRGARVGPNDEGHQRLIVRIEQREGVGLRGKADGGDG